METAQPHRSQVSHIISQLVNLHQAGQKAHIYGQVACSSQVFIQTISLPRPASYSESQ